MNESSSSESLELGINLKEFSKKRQVRLGSRKQTPTIKKEDTNEDAFPSELQYMNLLKRAMDILKKDRDPSNTNRVKLPLEVKREGRKTVVNVSEISQVLNRSVEHLVSYITSELVTTGSVNKEGKLLLKGTYIRSEVQEVIRRYIEHFVACKICDSVEDTDIVREKKLYFLKCHKCGGSRCVGNIIEGLTSKGKAKPQLRDLMKFFLYPMEKKTIEFKNIFLEVKNEDKNIVGKYVKLLDGVSGKFRSGVLTAVMGASGAGKSTLFDVLLGRVDDDAKTYGEVLYNGSERSEYDWIHKVSYLKQDDCYFPKFSIEESILYNLSLYQPFMSKKEKLEFSEEILKRANIYDKRLAYIESLSGGERKRAMIALSMCSDPDVIFMDEPTSGLDSHSALVLINFMKNYAAEKNKIVVISLHQPGEALFNLFEDIIYLGKGGMFYDGKISEIQSWLEEKELPKPEGISLAEYLFELHSATPYPPEIAQCRPKVDQIISENRANYETLRSSNVMKKGLSSLYFEMSFSFMAVLVLIKRFYINYFRTNSLLLGTICKALTVILILTGFFCVIIISIHASLTAHSYGYSNLKEVADHVKSFFTAEFKRHLSYFMFFWGRIVQALVPILIYNFFDNREIIVEDIYAGKYSVLTYFISYFFHDTIMSLYLFSIPIIYSYFTVAKSLINYWYYIYYLSLVPLCVINYMFIRLLTSKPGSSSKLVTSLVVSLYFLASLGLVESVYNFIADKINLPDFCKYIQCLLLIFPQFLLMALFAYKNCDRIANANIPKTEFHRYIPGTLFTGYTGKDMKLKKYFKFVCLENVSYSVFFGIFILSTLVNLFGALYLFNRQIRANLRLKLTK